MTHVRIAKGKRPQRKRLPAAKPKPINKSSNRMTQITVRLPKDMVERIDRMLKWLGPRIRTATGKTPGRADMVRAVILRGLMQAEKEFGLSEPPVRNILVDEFDG